MIYLISGLGADERVFSNLDFGNRPTTFLPWLIPEPREPMEKYLIRFSKNIDRENEIILVGVSFGGIIAVEIAKMFQVSKVILISGIKKPGEFSFMMRFLKLTKVYRLFPSSFTRKRFRFLSHFYFGSKTKEEKNALDNLIDESDDRVIDWSIDAMFKWKNEVIPKNLYHIHGTGDRIFPFRYLHQPFPVKDATHFMIANRAKEVSEYIQKILSDK